MHKNQALRSDPSAAPLPLLRRLRRTLQLTAALALATLGAATFVTTGCGEQCKGGILNADGTCTAKCDASKCANPGNICVNNRCALPCQSHTDCTAGSQDCTAAKDDSGKAVFVCEDSGIFAVGTKCPFGDCSHVTACPDGKACDYTQCGGQTCTPDPSACVDPAHCTHGTCPDKSACTVPGCAQTDCKPTFCVTTGMADADAFCTLRDCTSDAQCGGGYYCATVHDPHDICGPKCTASKCVGGSNAGGACAKDGDCQKGNNSLCGTTKEACIEPASFAANGATYKEGPDCLERNECRPRTQCDLCTTDLDCSIVPGQHCTTVGPEKVCTRDCATDTDCDLDYKCTTGECVPRFGSCTGTGKFCEPCRVDEDCKAVGGHYACVSLTGDQHACFDTSFPTSCTKSADCPTAPGGLHGECLDTIDNVATTDPSYHLCYFPINHGTDKAGCWCAPPDVGCSASAECCSGKCTQDPTTGIATCRCKKDADCSGGYTCNVSKGTCIAPTSN